MLRGDTTFAAVWDPAAWGSLMQHYNVAHETTQLWRAEQRLVRCGAVRGAWCVVPGEWAVQRGAWCVPQPPHHIFVSTYVLCVFIAQFSMPADES